jgi:hypothetical protein
MPPLRHRSRHLRATIFHKVQTNLVTLGWVNAPINFGSAPVTVVDYQPDERNEAVKTNTVAVSLGDVVNDADEELGAQAGGLRSAFYPVFVDVYMAEQALSDAICDDIRDIFDAAIFPLVDQIDGTDSGERIEIEEVIGPDRPTGLNAADPFKRYWRVMRLGVRLYYQS